MFINIGLLLLTVTRWVHQHWRRRMYLRLVRQVCSQCSIYVCKPLAGSESRLEKLLGSQLLQSGQKHREELLLLNNAVSVTAVTPKQTVGLGRWSAYIHPQGMYRAQASGEDVSVLLEAVRPINMQLFLQKQLSIAPAEKVHILSHGAAVAWHSGTPFGIILHCSLEEYITLMMAFVDGSLTMDEDLEVSSLLTVQTDGEPESFISQDSNSQSDVSGKGTRLKASKRQESALESQVVADLKTKTASEAGTVESGTDQQTEQWSNESLASNTSVGRTELMEMDNDILDNNDDVEDGDFMESGAGEDLSEIELEASSNSESLSQSWGLVKMSSVSKPPNLLVYTGKIDSVRKFEKVRAVLEQCLSTECYVIYHLKHDEIDQTPWMDNTCLLVIQARKVYPDANEAFLKYFKNGGKIFSIGSGFDTTLLGTETVRSDIWMSEISYKSWSNVPLIVGSSCYSLEAQKTRDVEVVRLATDRDKNVAIVKVKQLSKTGSGCAVLSQVLFDKDAGDFGVTPEFFNTLKKSNATRFEILSHLLTGLGLECSPSSLPAQTPAVLMTRDKKLQDQFMRSIESRLSSGLLKFGTQNLLFTGDTGSTPSDTILPVLTANGEAASANFNAGTYFEHLQSQVLGNTVMYVDVVPTTMTLLEGMLFSVPHDVGLVAIARQQTSGKGRGGNSWLSPVGCAMFTLHVRVALDSHLGRAVSFLQHISALAVVQSVVNLPGYQDIDLRLKWPNDIYYGSMMKLGGIIVKTTIMDSTVHATIGCGFNVSNSNPTICINDLIQAHNRQVREDLDFCSVEQLVARTITNIEHLVEDFQSRGPDSFKQQYYNRWLHGGKKVTLQSEGNAEVTIIGLDDYGYLLVKNQQGELISVQPDGNSFDMMQNLILLKSR